jgi:hypothetical protein
MKRILLSVMLLISSGLMAQRNCGSMDHLMDQLQQDPSMQLRMQEIENHTNHFIADGGAQSRALVTIPVVFHVLYNTTAQNLSDARIMAQLDVLNKDFARLNADASNTPAVFQGVAANTNIQFCLATVNPTGGATTGIIRKSTTVSSFSSNDAMKYDAQGGSSAWPANQYLNIWVCNLGGGLLGYAQFPGGASATDGVVLLTGSVGGPSAPGTSTPYNLGRTGTHEVGHWLNLRHIWGDANCGSDLVSDTPTQQTSNYGCPAFPRVTCSNGPNGDMFMNYMDYTDDACMNMFTAGQSTRAQALFGAGGARAGLMTSPGCGTVAPPPACSVSGLAATNVTASAATLNWTATSGASSYNIQYKPSTSSIWTLTTSTTNSKAISGLTASTTYQFQVQAVCSGTPGAYSIASSFTTSAAAGSGVTLTIGTGTATSGNTPYGTYFMDHRTQIIVTKAELTTAGYTSVNNIIRSLAFYVTTAASQSMNSFTIKISHTTSSSFGNTSYLTGTGTTTVFSGTVAAIANSWNTHTFTTPFTYNGNNNLLIDICWNNSSFSSDSQVRYSTTTNNMTNYKRQDVASGGICATTTGTRTKNRPNLRFVFSNTAAREMAEEQTIALDEPSKPVFSVFPNPSSNAVTFNYIVQDDDIPVSIKIFNLFGQEVANINKGLQTNGDYTHTLNLSENEAFSNGIYICTLIQGEKMESIRLVVQR